MAKNITMKRFNGSSWEEMYPVTKWENILNKPVIGGSPSYTYLGSRWGNGNIALASLHNSGYNFLLFRIAIDNYDDEEYIYTTYQTVTVDITKLLDVIHSYELHTAGRIKPIVYDDQGDSETIITIQYRLYRFNIASYVFVMNSNSSIKVEVFGGKY